MLIAQNLIQSYSSGLYRNNPLIINVVFNLIWKIIEYLNKWQVNSEYIYKTEKIDGTRVMDPQDV